MTLRPLKHASLDSTGVCYRVGVYYSMYTTLARATGAKSSPKCGAPGLQA